MLYCTAMDLKKIGLSQPSSVLWLIVLAVVIVGCPSKTVRYPAEHERLLRIDQALESLRSAYQRKDRSAFRAMLLPLDQLDELRRQAEMDFEAFSAIFLEFKIERVAIEKDESMSSSIGKGHGKEMSMTWVSGNEAMHGWNGSVRIRFSCAARREICPSE